MDLQLELNDKLFNMNTREVGTVCELSNQWGYVKVRYENGLVKEYKTGDTLRQTFRRLTKEQFADMRLSQEQHGITNHWTE